MKPIPLLLVASFLANFVLVGVIYSARLGESAAAKSAMSRDGAEKSSAKNRSASDDTALAGLPPGVARDAALGRAFARFAEKMRAARAAAAGDGKWWRRTGNHLSNELMLQARRELSDAMIAAFGDDLTLGGIDNSRLAFLPEEKRDKLRSILEDYDELMAKFGPQNGPQLASDKEKLGLLATERDRDIAALLSPEELADYQMRTSATANTLRNRYGDAITDEDEFKKLYTLQSAFDQKFPADSFNGRVSPDLLQQRTNASLQLQADMRAAVGDDAYAALQRAADTDLGTVASLVTRLNLPADTTDRVAALRDSYAAQSQSIMADTSTPFPQRRDQLQALAASAKTDLAATLGAEAADAYAQRSPWVSMLQNGIGYSTSAKDSPNAALALGGIGGASPSIFPVMPAGVAGNGARQVVNMVSTSGGSGAGGGQMFFVPTGASGSIGATQVYSVTSTVSGDGHTTSGATDTPPIKIITTSPPDAPPPASATPPKE